jgi:leucyl aminopeptidase (aminopeptidase T)
MSVSEVDEAEVKAIKEAKAIKAREDRLRRLLRRHNHCLTKTPSNSWLRREFGPGYMVVDYNNFVRLGCGLHEYEATLEMCEDYANDLVAEARQ